MSTALGDAGLPLTFGHLCKGDLQLPGALRVSAIVGNPVIGGRSHDDAFRRHVQRFGRETTLLNWLACWTHSLGNDVREAQRDDFLTVASFLVADPSGAGQPDAVAGQLLYANDDEQSSMRVMISPTLFRELVPDGLAQQYLDMLYDKKLEDTTAPATEYCGFSTTQLNLFSAKLTAWRSVQNCEHSKMSVAKLCFPYSKSRRDDDQGSDVEIADYQPLDTDILRLLSALQLAFAYSEYFAPDEFDSGGLVSVGLTPHYRPNQVGGRKSSMPLMAISTAVTTPGEVTTVRDKLAGILRGGRMSDALLGVKGNSHDVADPIIGTGATTFDRKEIDNLKTLLSSGPQPPYGTWSAFCASWMAHLVSWMRGSKHEGKPLEFVFVIGDMARIEDSPIFEKLELIGAKLDYPPSTSVSSVPDCLNHAKRVIEKENYFWFQNGRYALAWDLAWPDRRPRYLLGLKDSSWRVFVANARNSQQPEAAMAARIVGYLDDRGGGGLIINGEHAFSLSQDGQWIERGNSLTARIEGYLTAVTGEELADKNGLETNGLAKLRRAIVAVSNDPDSGCMLVFAETPRVKDSQPFGGFERMGNPWEVIPAARVMDPAANAAPHADGEPLGGDYGLSDDKLVALLGMDGAACIWQQDGIFWIRFRQLVRPKTKGGKDRPLCPEANRSLSGEGSRKWSAFLTAARTDVSLVIAVSQDGPVHFYTNLGNVDDAYTHIRKTNPTLHLDTPTSIRDCKEKCKNSKHVVHDVVS